MLRISLFGPAEKHLSHFFSIPVSAGSRLYQPLFFLAHYTKVPILVLYAVVSSVELIKVAIGSILINKGIWIKDITVSDLNL